MGDSYNSDQEDSDVEYSDCTRTHQDDLNKHAELETKINTINHNYMVAVRYNNDTRARGLPVSPDSQYQETHREKRLNLKRQTLAKLRSKIEKHNQSTSKTEFGKKNKKLNKTKLEFIKYKNKAKKLKIRLTKNIKGKRKYKTIKELKKQIKTKTKNKTKNKTKSKTKTKTK